MIRYSINGLLLDILNPSKVFLRKVNSFNYHLDRNYNSFQITQSYPCTAIPATYLCPRYPIPTKKEYPIENRLF